MARGQRSALSWHPLHSAADRRRERRLEERYCRRERVMIEEEKAERNRMMKEGSEKGNVMFSS